MTLSLEDVQGLAAFGLPLPEGTKMTMDVKMNMLAHDYNKPVSIELPPEAESATLLPMPG